jgi:hypothetical protein
MRRLLRHPVKSLLIVGWLGLFVLTWAVSTPSRLGLRARPLWQMESRDLSTTAAPARRQIDHADVFAAAGKQDGARVRYRAASVGEHRGVLRVTASSLTYVIDDVLSRNISLATNPYARAGGLHRYAADHGREGGPMFFLDHELHDRPAFRFPMAAQDKFIGGIGGTRSIGFQPPRYTYARTDDARTVGWDLDVRIPFWLIYLTLASHALLPVLARTARRLRRRRRQARGRCAECGYDLRGITSSQCPECGAHL